MNLSRVLEEKDIYYVDFWYGDYKQTVEFKSELLANKFFEDVKKSANRVELKKKSQLRTYQGSYDSGLEIKYDGSLVLSGDIKISDTPQQ
jgi:hypothetical protein